MQALAVEYRFRYWVHVAVYVLGFWAPWCGALGWARGSAWLYLAVELDRAGVATLSGGTVGLLGLGIVCAAAAAWLRTWGAAYLGSDVVGDGGMHSGAAGSGVVAEGPFRYVRNPLYLGTWVHTLALGLLMPVSGAVFCVVAIGVVQVRLILAEEGFLRGRLGEAYVAYSARVPRIVPRLRAKVEGLGVRGRWGQAVLGEVYFWGVALSFLALGWRYNASLLKQCVVVSVGVGLVARGLVAKRSV